MSNQGNYFPNQGPAPNGAGPGNINGPGPGAYPQQNSYNPYYPNQPGSYYPQQSSTGVYEPIPYGVPGQYSPPPAQINIGPAYGQTTTGRPNVQVNVQPVVPAPQTIVHQEKVATIY